MFGAGAAALIPYARNARTHSDEEDGIIAGHGRVLAAPLLGLDEVACIGRADRLSVEIKQVEKKVDEGIDVTRIGRGLDHAERGCAIRPNAAQLTVEIRLRGGQRGQRRCNRRVLVRPIEPRAGQQPHRTPIMPTRHVDSNRDPAL